METSEQILLKHIKHSHLSNFDNVDYIETKPEYILNAMREYAQLHRSERIAELESKLEIAKEALERIRERPSTIVDIDSYYIAAIQKIQ